jgi:hypothetical protein
MYICRTEFVQYMIDFCVEVVGCKEGPPTLKNRMGNLQNTEIDFGIVLCKARNQILPHVSKRSQRSSHMIETHVDQGIPAGPEVRVCNNVDGLS